MKLLFSVLLMAGFIVVAGAQPATNAARPRLVSPELHPDRSATFRLLAPNVTNVTVSGDWNTNTTAMTKGTNGTWTTTLPALNPGIYGYSYTVDGVQMPDTSNPQMK